MKTTTSVLLCLVGIVCLAISIVKTKEAKAKEEEVVDYTPQEVLPDPHSYAYEDESGCLHLDLDCIHLHPKEQRFYWSDLHLSKLNYAVRRNPIWKCAMVEAYGETPIKWCSSCVSDAEYEEILRIGNNIISE